MLHGCSKQCNRKHVKGQWLRVVRYENCTHVTVHTRRYRVSSKRFRKSLVDGEQSTGFNYFRRTSNAISTESFGGY